MVDEEAGSMGMDVGSEDVTSDSREESSDSEDVEMDAGDLSRMMEIEGQLKSNPNVYDTHLEYIALLRKCKLHERLRAARRRMHDLFPFNEQQWMDWINDEMDTMRSADDVKVIRELHAESVKDYLSANLWVSYLEFLKSLDPNISQQTPDGVKAFRAVAEEAIQAAGLHVAAGADIWNALRQYEQELLVVGADKAVEKVRSLYHRQLQVPLQGNAKLLEEYEDWEKTHGKGAVPDHVRKGAQAAIKAVELRAAHEDAIAADKPADANLLAAYLAYIKLEQMQGDPVRVQVLYERTVAAFPVTSELWLQYTAYLEQHLKLATVINKVYARAMHNCPWVGSLWCRTLQALERGGCTAEVHEQMYNKALAAGMQGPEDYLQVLLARAEFLRRAYTAAAQSGPTSPPAANGSAAPPSSSTAAAAAGGGGGGVTKEQLREHFTRATALMREYFPDYVDYSLRLPGYWVHVEAQVLGDADAGQQVWEDVVKGPLGRYCETWAAYAAWQRGLRRIAGARSVYKRGHKRHLEDGRQLALCAEWLRFEQEEGSAEDFFAARLKVDPVMEEASATAAAMTDAQTLAVAKAAAEQAPKLTKEEIAAMRRANDPNFKKAPEKSAKKRERQKKDVDEEKPGKRSKQEQQLGQHEQYQQHLNQQQQQRRDQGKVNKQKGAKKQSKENHVEPKEQQDQEMEDHDEGAAAAGKDAGQGSQAAAEEQRPRFTDEHTVFVKGLGYDVHEEDLRKLFAPAGGLKAIRMGRDRDTGDPKGFAYVEFESDDAVQAAVQHNGIEINGRHLFIAKSAPPRGGGGRGGGERGGRFAGAGRGGMLPRVHVSAAHGNMGHQRNHLQLDEEKTGARVPAMLPRSMVAPRGRGPGRAGAGRQGAGRTGGGTEAVQQQQQQQQARVDGQQGAGSAAATAVAGGAPKTNDDFRKMFLK